MSPNHDLELIRQALKTNRNVRIALAAGGLLGGLLLVFYLPEATGLPLIAIRVIGALLAFVSCYIAYRALLLYNVHDDEVLKTLEKQPGEIVWVFYYEVQQMPYGVRILHLSSLYFYLKNREKLSITMSRKKILRLLPLLKKRLPHATFGYSEAKEQLYVANPEMLIRN